MFGWSISASACRSASNRASTAFESISIPSARRKSPTETAWPASRRYSYRSHRPSFRTSTDTVACGCSRVASLMVGRSGRAWDTPPTVMAEPSRVPSLNGEKSRRDPPDSARGVGAERASIRSPATPTSFGAAREPSSHPRRVRYPGGARHLRRRATGRQSHVRPRRGRDLRPPRRSRPDDGRVHPDRQAERGRRDHLRVGGIQFESGTARRPLPPADDVALPGPRLRGVRRAALQPTAVHCPGRRRGHPAGGAVHQGERKDIWGWPPTGWASRAGPPAGTWP